MPAAPRVLADVNIWLATLLEEHPHHAAAIAWWRERLLPRGGSACLCRLTQMSLLRLLCNRLVMGRAVRDPRQAWRDYDDLLAQPAVAFLQEPVGLEARWREIEHLATGRGGWTDSYLAAFACAHDIELVTFDAGFRRFPGLRLQLPLL